jgi:uncharacterized protein YqjF (DUF2071 family)
MAQSWHDLLFAHWPLSPTALRDAVPRALEIDTFDGRAWLGVIAFRLSDIHLHGLLPLPGLDAFPEVNLRTYVTYHGQRGVLFLSLHCPNRLAMAIARPWFHLPYRYADTSLTADFNFSACAPDGAAFVASYRPTGAPRPAVEGELDAWLTERYCYFTANRHGAIERCAIAHPRWQLSPAEASIEYLTLHTAFGLELPTTTPRLGYAKHMDALIWPLDAPESAMARPLPGPRHRK